MFKMSCYQSFDETIMLQIALIYIQSKLKKGKFPPSIPVWGIIPQTALLSLTPILNSC